MESLTSKHIADLLRSSRPRKVLDLMDEGAAARFDQWRRICTEFETELAKNHLHFDRREFLTICGYF